MKEASREKSLFCIHVIHDHGPCVTFGCVLITNLENSLVARSSFRRFKISNFGTNWSICQPFFFTNFMYAVVQIVHNGPKHVCNVSSL